MLTNRGYLGILICLLLWGDLSGARRRLAAKRGGRTGHCFGCVLEFVEAADKLDAMHSFMLVRHGRVVAECWWAPYRAEARHSLYSLSKSFTSTAVGLAVADGKLQR